MHLVCKYLVFVLFSFYVYVIVKAWSLVKPIIYQAFVIKPRRYQYLLVKARNEGFKSISFWACGTEFVFLYKFKGSMFLFLPLLICTISSLASSKFKQVKQLQSRIEAVCFHFNIFCIFYFAKRKWVMLCRKSFMTFCLNL